VCRNWLVTNACLEVCLHVYDNFGGAYTLNKHTNILTSIQKRHMLQTHGAHLILKSLDAENQALYQWSVEICYAFCISYPCLTLKSAHSLEIMKLSPIIQAWITGWTSYTTAFKFLYTAPAILHSITMKPYIKAQYYMITTIPLCDNYFLVVII